MRTAISRFLSPSTLGLASWGRSESRNAPQERSLSARRARPFLAALLIGAAGALLVGGCLVAAWLGGILGIGAALIGFTAYLFVFGSGLDHLPVDWNSWRERKYREFYDDAGNRKERNEGNSGGEN